MIEQYKDQKEVQMIVFKLGNEEYTVPITCVQEIIMPQSPSHIPKSPSWVEGIINLRGKIIPVIDGRKKFQIDAKTSSAESRIMVLDVEHEVIGLIVDAVSEVVHLKTDDIEPAPIDMEEDSDFLWGVGKHQDRLLILINPEKFLSNSEAHDLKKLTKIPEVIRKNNELTETTL